MPNVYDCRGRDFSEYDSMSTPQLQALLREDASKSPGEESDTALILHVMEILVKRGEGAENTPQEALAAFKEEYATENFFISEQKEKAPRKAIRIPWKRCFAAVAAAITVFFLGSFATIRAFSIDLGDYIGKWNDTVFYFGRAREDDSYRFDPPEFDGLKDAAKQLGFDDLKLPNYLPEGFKTMHLNTDNNLAWKSIHARYSSDAGELIILITDYSDDSSSYTERDQRPVEIYRVDETDYYIFYNIDNVIAAWMDGPYECIIIGPISVEEMKKMINSIE